MTTRLPDNTCSVCGRHHNGVPHFICENIAVSQRPLLLYRMPGGNAAFLEEHKEDFARVWSDYESAIKKATQDLAIALEDLLRMQQERAE